MTCKELGAFRFAWGHQRSRANGRKDLSFQDVMKHQQVEWKSREAFQCIDLSNMPHVQQLKQLDTEIDVSNRFMAAPYIVPDDPQTMGGQRELWTLLQETPEIPTTQTLASNAAEVEGMFEGRRASLRCRNERWRGTIETFMGGRMETGWCHIVYDDGTTERLRLIDAHEGIERWKYECVDEEHEAQLIEKWLGEDVAHMVSNKDHGLVWVTKSNRTWLATIHTEMAPNQNVQRKVHHAYQVLGKKWGQAEAATEVAHLLCSRAMEPQVESFVGGCHRGLAQEALKSKFGRARPLRIMALALARSLQYSVDLVEGLLQIERITFHKKFGPDLRPYRHTTEEDVANNWPLTVSNVEAYVNSTETQDDLWHCGCQHATFMQTWRMCKQAQCIPQREPPCILDALLDVVCTLLTSDCDSMLKCCIARRKIAVSGGVRQCVIQCLEEETCTGQCSLSAALSHTVKQSKKGLCTVNVDMFRSVGRTFPHLLDVNHDEPIVVYDVTWLLDNKSTWLSKRIVGVQEVVFAKLVSMLNVGQTAILLGGTRAPMAWDSRLVGLRLGMPYGAGSEEWAVRFGFPEVVDWWKVECQLDKWKSRSLSHAAKALRKTMRKKLQHAVKRRRADVGTLLQKNLPTAAVDFCNKHGVDPSLEEILGLRECWRFLYGLHGLEFNCATFAEPALMCAKVDAGQEECKAICAAVGLAPSDVYLSEAGVVYCHMHQLLCPTDTAFWWVYPGNLVQWDGLDQGMVDAMARLSSKGPPAALFIGATLNEAYRRAAARSTSLEDMLNKLGRQEFFVQTWKVKLDPCEGERVEPWSFDVHVNERCKD